MRVAADADGPLAVALDAVMGQLRAAVVAGDIAAVARLRAALDALIGPAIATAAFPRDNR